MNERHTNAAVLPPQETYYYPPEATRLQTIGLAITVNWELYKGLLNLMVDKLTSTTRTWQLACYLCLLLLLLVFLPLFELQLNETRTLLIVAFYLQKDVYWRFELGDYRSYVTLALTY